MSFSRFLVADTFLRTLKVIQHFCSFTYIFKWWQEWSEKENSLLNIALKYILITDYCALLNYLNYKWIGHRSEYVGAKGEQNYILKILMSIFLIITCANQIWLKTFSTSNFAPIYHLFLRSSFMWDLLCSND